ncbi:Sialidase [Hyaloscypha sp. PMI_1271]|nr:Sialidase [Hyaloscypha sp. PMI_1271]
MGHGTYPRATKLRNGLLLGVYTAFENGENVIVTTNCPALNNGLGCSILDDNLVWERLGEVTRGIGDVDNPFLLQLENGNILCAFRNHTTNAVGNQMYFRITICASEDGGRCWKYLSTAEESSNPARGLWEPFLRLAKDDDLQLYYSHENSPLDQDSIQRISHDGGQSWGEAKVISGQGILARDGMIGVAEVSRLLVAVFETDEDGIMHIKSVTSRDDGKTWGERSVVYRAKKGVAAAPQVAACGFGLLVTFQTDEDGTGSRLKAIYGRPGDWRVKMLVGPEEGESVWGGIMKLDEGNAMILFDHNGGCKTRKITYTG